MPEIQQYQETTDAAQPITPVSPNEDAYTAPSRAMEKGFDTLEQKQGVINQVKKQEEVSKAYDDFAQMRVDKMQDMQDQVANGTFDSQKFSQDYDDQVSKMRDDYSTPGGADFFDRQSAKLKSHLMQGAITAQGVQSANQATALLQGSADKNVASIMSNPGQYDDVVDSTDDYVKELATDNPKLAGHQATLSQGLKGQYAEAAVMGFIDKGMASDVKDMMDHGHYVDNMTASQQFSVRAKVNAAIQAQDADGPRMERQAKIIHEQAVDQAMRPYLAGMQAGTMSPKVLLNLSQQKDPTGQPLLSVDEVIKYTNIIKAQAKNPQDTDPTVFRDIQQRISSGDIKNMRDPMVMNELQVGGVSTKHIDMLQHEMDTSTQGLQEKEMRKSLLQNANKTFNQNQDPEGPQRLMNFTQGLQQAERQADAQGLPRGTLYDPTSPTYFGKNVQGRSAVEVMQIKNQAMLKSLSGPQPGTTQPLAPPAAGAPLGKPQPQKLVPVGATTKDLNAILAGKGR